jgi:excisionase family DNA binding protein
MNEFGQKGKVLLSERLSVSAEEASALTGIGLTSIRAAISSGELKAKKHGRRTIILPDDLKVWLKTLPAPASLLNTASLDAGLLVLLAPPA